MNMTPITVESTIKAPITKVWDYYNKPEHITHWAFADDSWEAPSAENDLRTGGKFKTVMAAKDKSAQFDFTGTYTMVKEHELIEYDMPDGRHVRTEYSSVPEGTRIKIVFDPENKNSEEKQKTGWQGFAEI